MPTIFEQELTREQAAVTTAEQIKDGIKTVAENKGLTVEETDTPLSVLTKIDNSTIATPTETISITENGTVDVTNYASANVNVPSGSVTNKLPQVIDKSVTTITADDLTGATSIAQYAFYNCRSLTSITLPSTLTSIGYGAFYNCSGLTSITIPEGVTSISWHAFNGCSSLTSMRVRATTPPTLSDVSAISTATTQIQVPMASVEAYKTATNWSNFADIIVGYTE